MGIVVCIHKGCKVIETIGIMGNKTYKVEGVVYTFKSIDYAKDYIDSIS